MTKIELTIRRPNGNVETIDISKNFGSMNQEIFNQIKKQTKAGNGSDVLKATMTRKENNLYDLIKKYNDVNNEGGEGYIPDSEYFENIPEYSEKEVTMVFK